MHVQRNDLSCLEVQAIGQSRVLVGTKSCICRLDIVGAVGAIHLLEPRVAPLSEQVGGVLEVEHRRVLGIARPHDGRHGHEAAPSRSRTGGALLVAGCAFLPLSVCPCVLNCVCVC